MIAHVPVEVIPGVATVGGRDIDGDRGWILSRHTRSWLLRMAILGAPSIKPSGGKKRGDHR